MRKVKSFDQFINESGNIGLVGKEVETGWGETITVTDAVYDSLIEFLRDENIDVTVDAAELLLNNLMPGQEGVDALEAGLAYQISTSDFDSWEDVRSNFEDMGLCAPMDDEDEAFSDED
jgi:hypothetical protein